MTIWQSLAGLLQVEITCPYPEEMLTAINIDKIRLWDIIPLSQVSFLCTVRRQDCVRLRMIAGQYGGSVNCRKMLGSYWSVLTISRRPVLVFSVLLLIVLTIFLPTRVLFVEVEGNEEVPDSLILETAEICGIHFGVSRERIRSEIFKNALLEKLPQLQWAGVNTCGCTALISVRERAEDNLPDSGQTNAIVAARNGIIRSMTVTKGTANCEIGETVTEGQLLVSGYADCGLVIKATGADAEIYGETKRDIMIVAPNLWEKTEEYIPAETRYSIILGKKLINLSQDSGISDSTCVKMYKTNYVILPGDFQLPIGMVTEYRQSINEPVDYAKENFDWLLRYAEEYIKAQMVSGRILDSEYVAEVLDDCTVLYGELSCTEIIGRTQIEETLIKNGEEH